MADLNALVAELRALEAKAMPAPWHACNDDGVWVVAPGEHADGRSFVCASEGGDGEQEALLVAAARNALPALLDALETAQARIATLEAALASGLEVCEVAKDMTFAPWAVHAKKLLAGAALRGGKETPGE